MKLCRPLRSFCLFSRERKEFYLVCLGIKKIFVFWFTCATYCTFKTSRSRAGFLLSDDSTQFLSAPTVFFSETGNYRHRSKYDQVRRTLNPIFLQESDSPRLIYFFPALYRLSSFPSAKKQNLHLNVIPPSLYPTQFVFTSANEGHR